MKTRTVLCCICVFLLLCGATSCTFIQLKKQFFKDPNCREFKYTPADDPNTEGKYVAMQFSLGKCTRYNMDWSMLATKNGDGFTIKRFNSRNCDDEKAFSENFRIGECIIDKDGYCPESICYHKYIPFNEEEGKFYYEMAACSQDDCRRPQVRVLGSAFMQNTCILIETMSSFGMKSQFGFFNGTHRVENMFKNTACSGKPDIQTSTQECEFVGWRRLIYDFSTEFYL